MEYDSCFEKLVYEALCDSQAAFLSLLQKEKNKKFCKIGVGLLNLCIKNDSLCGLKLLFENDTIFGNAEDESNNKKFSKTVLDDALYSALNLSKDTICIVLLENGATLDLRPASSKNILYCAISSNCSKVIEHVLNGQVSAEIPLSKVMMKKALSKAIRLGSESCSAVLLKYNAPTDLIISSANNSVYCAINSGCSKVAQMLLLKEWSNGNFDSSEKAEIIDRSVLEYLPAFMNLGVDVNARDKYGQTPLMWSCGLLCKESYNLVSTLLSHNAEVNASDFCGKTALHYTCDSNPLSSNEFIPDIVNLLMTSGAEIDATDYGGNTALHVANINAIPILLSYFPDTLINSRDGETGYQAVFHRLFDRLSLFKLTCFTECLELLKFSREKLPSVHDILSFVPPEYHTVLKKEVVQCLLELKSMQEHKLIKNISVCDVLLFSDQLLYPFCRNVLLLKSLCPGNLGSQYPIFQGLLIKKYFKLKLRSNLVNRSIPILSECLEFLLPDLLIEKVLSHLSNDDLKVIADNGISSINAS